MTDKSTQLNTPSNISQRIMDLAASLNQNQLRYVAVRIRKPGISKSEAAIEAGVSRHTVYHWPEEVDELHDLMMLDALSAARALLINSVARAMSVKLSGLESTDEKIKQKSATELYEWVAGRASQTVEHSMDRELQGFMRDLVGLGDGTE